MNHPQRLPYVDPACITDPAMMAEFQRAAREGAPRPESHAIRANVPDVFWAFTHAWNNTFVNGVCDHAIKELCRLYVSQAVNCNYCGNQRSVKAQAQGLLEDDVKDLLDFDKSQPSPGAWSPPMRCGRGCMKILKRVPSSSSAFLSA